MCHIDRTNVKDAKSLITGIISLPTIFRLNTKITMQRFMNGKHKIMSYGYTLSMVYQKLSNHPTNMEVTFHNSDKPQRSTNDCSPRKLQMTVYSQISTIISAQ